MTEPATHQDVARHLRSLAAELASGRPIDGPAVLALAELLAKLARVVETQPNGTDPLAGFPAFDPETDELGTNYDGPFGFTREIPKPATVCALIGAWATPTKSRATGAPMVYWRAAVRAFPHEAHHVLEGVAHVDTARELGVTLYAVAERTPLDVAADRLWEEL